MTVIKHLEKLKARFEAMRQSASDVAMIHIRRYRATQLKQWLSTNQPIDIAEFNREVWRIHDQQTKNAIRKLRANFAKHVDTAGKITKESLEQLEQDIASSTFTGNTIWGSGSHIYGSTLKDKTKRHEYLQQALSILINTSLSPIKKTDQISSIHGFGLNSTTGLVMVFHPNTFGLCNDVSQAALEEIGYQFKKNDVNEVQNHLQDLKDKLSASDFLELDWFLYCLNQNLGGHLLDDDQTGLSITQQLVSRLNEGQRFWWVNQGNTYQQEQDSGCIFAQKSTTDGRQNVARKNVYRVQPKDVIIHYAQGVRAVSVATSEVYDSGRDGEAGWQVDTDYLELSTPLALDIIPLAWRQTENVGPFNIHGVPKQGYLYELSTDFARNLSQLLTKKTPANTWIFQGNPKVSKFFDKLPNMHIGDVDDWSVTLYKNDVQQGDRIILWQSGRRAGAYAMGEIIGDVYTDDNPDPFTNKSKRTAVKFRLVRIFNPPTLKDKLLEHPVLKALSILKNPQGTNFRVSQTEWQALADIVDAHAPKPLSLEDIQQQTKLELSRLQTWITALKRKKQAIFYGPPGTGKTFVAQKLARYLAGSNGFTQLVQFHSAYAYEDFIQGLRPQSDSEGNLSYPLVPGRFFKFIERASSFSGKCILIIDEINRADLSRVFGELMYLLEYRDETIPLAGGGELSIPSNVYLIGTMNTADRSIALVDHALRRRFAFLKLSPIYSLLKDFHHQQPAARYIDTLIEILKNINHNIGDPNYHLGVSFFLHQNLDEYLEIIWTTEIEPYLEEQFFDRLEQVEAFRWSQVVEELSFANITQSE